MRHRYSVPLAGGLVVGGVGWALNLLLSALALFRRDTPNNDFYWLVTAAAAENPERYTDAEASAIMSAMGLFTYFAVPVCAGVLTGLVVGAVKRLSVASLLLGGVFFSFLSLNLGSASVTKLLGATAFFFSIVGAAHVSASSREAISGWLRARRAA